jgi:hypothetical protein
VLSLLRISKMIMFDITIVTTKMQGYTLLSTPAIFIISGLFFHYLSVNRSRYKYRWIPIVVMVLLFALPIRFAFERVKPFTQIDRNPEWQAKMIEFTEQLPDDKQVLVFNVDTPIEMMFYSNATVYRVVPEPSVIDSLINDGYQVYINGGPGLEDSIERVTYINLPAKPH